MKTLFLLSLLLLSSPALACNSIEKCKELAYVDFNLARQSHDNGDFQEEEHDMKNGEIAMINIIIIKLDEISKKLDRANCHLEDGNGNCLDWKPLKQVPNETT